MKIESQAVYGMVELPVAGTEGAELAQIHSDCGEFLDAIVAGVGDVQVAARVDGDLPEMSRKFRMILYGCRWGQMYFR